MKTAAKITAVLFLAVQFWQPPRNIASPEKTAADSGDFIELHPEIPAEIESLLRTSCYNCHSNHTRYQFYDFIQPGRFLVESHIKNGKKELNLSEWSGYIPRKQERLLRTMAEQIETGAMPLPAYTFIHADARLDSGRVKQISEWLRSLEF